MDPADSSSTEAHAVPKVVGCRNRADLRTAVAFDCRLERPHAEAGGLTQATPGTLEARSVVIATYALSGFANLGSSVTASRNDPCRTGPASWSLRRSAHRCGSPKFRCGPASPEDRHRCFRRSLLAASQSRNRSGSGPEWKGRESRSTESRSQKKRSEHRSKRNGSRT